MCDTSVLDSFPYMPICEVTFSELHILYLKNVKESKYYIKKQTAPTDIINRSQHSHSRSINCCVAQTVFVM
jgi:hypothetical protein